MRRVVSPEFLKGSISADIARLTLQVLGVATSLIFRIYPITVLAAAILAFSAIYTISIHRNICGVQDRAWFWYISPFTDSVFIAIFMVLLGNINSITTAVFIMMTVMGALNPHIRKGLVAAVTGGAAFAGIGALAYLGIIPRLNLLGAGQEITLQSLVVYAIVFFLVLLSTQSSVSRIARRSEELLDLNKAERQKSDRLLENILPKSVADELKAKGVYAPVRVENVTVLFTDFVGFTSSASRADPAALIAALDGYFTRFDSIVAAHHLEKLKTIGDGYMCAAGLLSSNPAHAVDSCLAALEILEFVEATKESSGLRWDIRIGLNSGPVIAGIIGKSKFSYDI